MSRAVENWLFGGCMVIFLAVFRQPSSIMANDGIDMIFDVAGLVLCVAGLLVRVVARDWKSIHRKDCLVSDGPYAIVRHPMYVGSFLAGLGLCMIYGSIEFMAVYAAGFILVHVMIAKREDAYMDSVWLDEHTNYSKSVPACLPSFGGFVTFFKSYKGWLSSGKAAFRRERGAILGFLLAACIFEVAADVVESGWPDVRHEVFFWLLAILGILTIWLIVCGMPGKSKKSE